MKMLHDAAARRVAVVAITLAMTACSRAPEPGAAAPVTAVAYVGARIVTGEDSPAIEGGVLVVDQGKVVAVGAAGSTPIPDGAAQVDLAGKTVIPALIDAHTHLSTTRDGLLTDLTRRAAFGVGGALSLGNDGPGAPLEMRNEVLSGAAGYRTAGLGITAPEPGRNPVHWVTTVEEARQAVRDEAARSVDVIKIWVDDRNGQYTELSPELYRAAIDEAHQAGLRVAAHIFALDDAKELLRAGVDIFAHGVRDRDVDEEFIALVKERPGVVLIPNMGARGEPTDLAWLQGRLPAEEFERAAAANVVQGEAQAAHAIQARNLAALAAAGMTIAFGTDGNTPWAPHVEIEDMVLAGLSPAQALVAATRNAAAVAGFADQGTLAPGKYADFVVLDANPLDDITNTRRISGVYLRGSAVGAAVR